MRSRRVIALCLGVSQFPNLAALARPMMGPLRASNKRTLRSTGCQAGRTHPGIIDWRINVTSMQCGATTTDFCSPVLNSAYRQADTPNNVWDLPSMPRATLTMNLPGPLDPGAAFVTPTEATLFGATLTNPTGPWSTTATDPGFSWVDHDNDGNIGFTTAMTIGGTSPNATCRTPAYRFHRLVS